MRLVKKDTFNLGSQTLAHSLHTLSKEATLFVGSLASFANQYLAGNDCSNHCSRSFASYTLTSFHLLRSFFCWIHLSFPGQRRGVTKIKVIFEESEE